jgi:hypothetical protein
MDPGLAASRRPGMTPDMIQTSETLHWCIDSMKPITSNAWSFRGTAKGREPGIHNPGRWLWIPGSPLRGAPE